MHHVVSFYSGKDRARIVIDMPCLRAYASHANSCPPAEYISRSKEAQITLIKDKSSKQLKAKNKPSKMAIDYDFEHSLIGRTDSGLRRVAFNLDSNRTHYTYASHVYDRSYQLEDAHVDKSMRLQTNMAYMMM